MAQYFAATMVSHQPISLVQSLLQNASLNSYEVLRICHVIFSVPALFSRNCDLKMQMPCSCGHYRLMPQSIFLPVTRKSDTQVRCIMPVVNNKTSPIENGALGIRVGDP